MMTQDTHYLDDRALLRVAGEDAFSFLQNIVTADLRAVDGGGMAYSCLLGPQGRVLHEFFILPGEGGGYMIDCDAGRMEDLSRRLSMYKLRARVELAPVDGVFVYAGKDGIADPRLPALGGRAYAREKRDALARGGYDDLCISLGVPPSVALKPDKDFPSDMNFDLLRALSFDKGCFVGQEVAARMHHRGLAKKRLVVVEGKNLAPGDALLAGGGARGDIRAVSSDGARGLAVARLDAVEAGGLEAGGKGPVRARLPGYGRSN